jgi:hypothetical protein
MDGDELWLKIGGCRVLGQYLCEEFLLYLLFGQVEVLVCPLFSEIHSPIFYFAIIKFLELLILLDSILNGRLLVFKLNHIRVLILLK